MKRLSNLFAALVFASLVIFMSCGGGGGGGSDPTGAEINSALMGGSWTTSTSNVTYGGAAEGDWDNFSLTISNATSSGGDYSVSGVPSGYEVVWPSSGSWTFVSDAGTQITRSDDIVMSLSVEEGAMTLQFTIPDPNGRTSGLFDQAWVFSFTQ